MTIPPERRYGLHRVEDEPGVFPQPARRLNSDPKIGDDELLIDVERLNLDSASFRQLSDTNAGDPVRIATAITAIVAQRGKMHNPVTGSGGMLVGTVRKVGAALAAERAVRPGQRIATLISLTLTPLRIESVDASAMHHGQVGVTGTAVLFASSPFAVLPDDIPERIALAALDVAGAPSRTATLVKPGDTVVLIGGGGTSGLLTLHAARQGVGKSGTVVVTDASESALADVRSTGLADAAVAADATDPLELHRVVTAAAGGEADVTVNLVNVPATELGTILVTKESGTVLFFSMSTSFTAAALGAEGLGRATTMIVGNGHMPDTGDTALGVLRASPEIRAIFERRYGG